MTEQDGDGTNSFVFDSGLAERYDATRTVDQEQFDAALEFFVDRFPPQTYSAVVDAGVGTGRIGAPVAERGYHVTGIDRSTEMLAHCRQRIKNRDQHSLSCVRGDVTTLPFATATFDLALAVHLVYFVGNWQHAVNELLRVLTEQGVLVVMHTGFGRSIPSVNKRYQQLCAEKGHPINTPGVDSSQVVVEWARQQDYDVEQIRDRWMWTASVHVGTALQNLAAKSYSSATVVPDTVHEEVICDLRSHLREEYGSLDTTVEVPNQLYMVFITR